MGSKIEALASNPEELLFRPNILRLRGDLHLRLDDSASAEADFRSSIEIAREQGCETMGVAGDDQSGAAARVTGASR